MAALPTIHANLVLVGAAGVLIRGASGSGKTSLARRLAAVAGRDGGFGCLVSDDRVAVAACHGRLVARPPAALAGLCEMRGRGVEATAFEPAAVVRLVVDLVPAAEAERMPEEAALVTEILDVRLPRQPVAVGAGDAVGLVLAALKAALASTGSPAGA